MRVLFVLFVLFVLASVGSGLVDYGAQRSVVHRDYGPRADPTPGLVTAKRIKHGYKKTQQNIRRHKRPAHERPTLRRRRPTNKRPTNKRHPKRHH